eukprot:m.30406 g.30406  ORF g.30406 m.30406 type:complete len:529 (-) comp9637_c0_seq1:252-1838(-)
MGRSKNKNNKKNGKTGDRKEKKVSAVDNNDTHSNKVEETHKSHVSHVEQKDTNEESNSVSNNNTVGLNDTDSGKGTTPQPDVLPKPTTALRRQMRRHIREFGKVVRKRGNNPFQRPISEEKRSHLQRWRHAKRHADLVAEKLGSEVDGITKDEDTPYRHTKKEFKMPAIISFLLFVLKWLFYILFAVYAVYSMLANFPLVFDKGVRQALYPETLPHSPFSPHDGWCPQHTFYTDNLPFAQTATLASGDVVPFRSYGTSTKMVSLMLADAYCPDLSLHSLAEKQAAVSSVFTLNSTFSNEVGVISNSVFKKRLIGFIKEVLDVKFSSQPHQRGYRLLLVAQGFTAGHVLALMNDNEFRAIMHNGGRIVLLSPLIHPFGPVGQEVQHKLQTDYVLLKAHSYMEDLAWQIEEQGQEYNNLWKNFSGKVRANLQKKYVAVWHHEGLIGRMRRTELDMFYPMGTLSPNTTLQAIKSNLYCMVIVPKVETYTSNLVAAIRKNKDSIVGRTVPGQYWSMADKDETVDLIADFFHE